MIDPTKFNGKKLIAALFFCTIFLSGCREVGIQKNAAVLSETARLAASSTLCCVANRPDLGCVPCPVANEKFEEPMIVPVVVPPPTSTAITQSQASTWPRHIFKEVGFSVQLPFPVESVDTEYVECKDGFARGEGGTDLSQTDFQRSCNPDKGSYYLFRALVNSPWSSKDHITFLEHVSMSHTFMTGWENSFSGLWSLLSTKNFSRNGVDYHYSYLHDGTEIPNTPLVPYKTIDRPGGRIVLFDLNKDLGPHLYDSLGDVAILVEQPNNKRFKQVVLEFWGEFTGTTKTQAEDIAKSIKFLAN